MNPNGFRKVFKIFAFFLSFDLCNKMLLFPVAAGMSCHNQCNETYRCWGPADTDCVVCKVYLYRNGAERICVESCESTRLQSLNV